MDLAQALNTLDNPRFRELTDEGNPDLDQRDAYRKLVLELAARDSRQVGANPEVNGNGATVPVATAWRAARLGWRQCFYSTHDSKGGCSCVKCFYLGRGVSLHDCVACLG